MFGGRERRAISFLMSLVRAIRIFQIISLDWAHFLCKTFRITFQSYLRTKRFVSNWPKPRIICSSGKLYPRTAASRPEIVAFLVVEYLSPVKEKKSWHAKKVSFPDERRGMRIFEVKTEEIFLLFIEMVPSRNLKESFWVCSSTIVIFL